MIDAMPAPDHSGGSAIESGGRDGLGRSRSAHWRGQFGNTLGDAVLRMTEAVGIWARSSGLGWLGRITTQTRTASSARRRLVPRPRLPARAPLWLHRSEAPGRCKMRRMRRRRHGSCFAGRGGGRDIQRGRAGVDQDRWAAPNRPEHPPTLSRTSPVRRPGFVLLAGRARLTNDARAIHSRTGRARGPSCRCRGGDGDELPPWQSAHPGAGAIA
jgi:hypothetical protein